MIHRFQTSFPGFELSQETKHSTGILPSQKLRELIETKQIYSEQEIDADQVQPASLDLRLGSVAYQVSASFLPNEKSTVRAKLDIYSLKEISLTNPAILESNNVYVVQLEEHLSLPPKIWGKANPKSSTGRLDVFTRLLTDFGREFDLVGEGYKGPLYAEIVPGSFSVKVARGARLGQLRLSQGSPVPFDSRLKTLDEEVNLVFGIGGNPEKALIDEGLRFSVDLSGDGVIGYRARTHAGVIDMSRVGHYDPREFWDPIRGNARQDLVLEPGAFYILASREKVRIPSHQAAEMIPYHLGFGEFRIHYAGFFDPGFGYRSDDIRGTRAVLEVRSHGIPFLLEHGQPVGRLVFERLMDVPDKLYGQGIGSSYQSQGLALSKHFRPFTHEAL